MKSKNVVILSGVILLSLISLIYLFFFNEKKTVLSSPRVLLIGLDGAGWNLINPLLEENALPNIKYLVDTGSYGVLKTVKPTKSSIIWTSIATGKSMVKHGVVDWTYINDNKIEVPFRQSERRAKTFWNILSELGWKVGVINWFITFPPEKVNGYMVSEEFRHFPIRHQSDVTVTYPKVLQKKLQFAYRTKKDFPTIRKQERLPDFAKWTSTGEGPKRLAPFYSNFVLEDKIIELASLYLYKRYPVDMYATYFRLIDVVSHFSCGYIDPQILNKGIEEEKKGKISKETLLFIDKAFSKIMKSIYAYADRILGKFLELTNSQSTIIVVSDHAFGYHNGGYGHSDTPEIPHGIIMIKGPNIKKNYKITDAHIYDILPTILYLFNLPVAKDMDGKVLTAVFDDNFLKKRPIKYIESYEGEIKLKKGIKDKKLDKKYLEELRALGYIK